MAKKINLHYMVLIFLIVLLAVFMGFRSPYFFTAANLCVLVDNHGFGDDPGNYIRGN